MKQYLDLLSDVMENGVDKGDRTGTGTRSVFGRQLRFDLAKGFPLVTTKKTWFRGLAEEMIWMLSGSTSIFDLVSKGVSIWTNWPFERYLKKAPAEEVLRVLGVDRDTFSEPSDSPAYCGALKRFEGALLAGEIDGDWGELGPVYGGLWRQWPEQVTEVSLDTKRRGTAYYLEMTDCVDQIRDSLHMLEESPDSRRNIISAWNPALLHLQALPSCHMFWQLWTAPHGDTRKLSLQVYIRSNDLFLGAPFNIAQYALLVHMIARSKGFEVGDLVYTIGDAHIYNNHFDQVREQLTRTPLYLPTLTIEKKKDLLAYRFEDLTLKGYTYHAAIKAPVAV